MSGTAVDRGLESARSRVENHGEPEFDTRFIVKNGGKLRALFRRSQSVGSNDPSLRGSPSITFHGSMPTIDR